jgi:hypothetical protein
MVLTMTTHISNELARALLKHEGIRVGEIIAYRAWRVIEGNWLRKGDDYCIACSCGTMFGTRADQPPVM